MPQPSHPLTTYRRFGVVADVSSGPGNLIGVDIGGDNAGNDWDSGIHEYVSQTGAYANPTVGDVVLLLGIPGDWCIIGKVGGPGLGYARYEGHRNATGVGAGVYDTPPSCPTSNAGSPWHTNTTFSDPNTWKRFTIIKNCHIDFWCTFQCSGGTNPFAEMQLRVPTSTSTGVTTTTSTSPGGGLSQGYVSYSGLLVAGEVLDVILRNTGTVTTNLQYKIFCTFTDATYSTAEQ